MKEQTMVTEANTFRGEFYYINSFNDLKWKLRQGREHFGVLLIKSTEWVYDASTWYRQASQQIGQDWMLMKVWWQAGVVTFQLNRYSIFFLFLVSKVFALQGLVNDRLRDWVESHVACLNKGEKAWWNPRQKNRADITGQQPCSKWRWLQVLITQSAMAIVLPTTQVVENHYPKGFVLSKEFTIDIKPLNTHWSFLQSGFVNRSDVRSRKPRALQWR